MHSFIFQSVQKRYDLREKIEVGKPDTWYATRYRSEMNVGDIAYFWMGGVSALRGLYGWGRLVSSPYLKPDWDSHGVDVIYNSKFNEPILERDLKSDPILKELLLFRAPQASNFLLSKNESDAIVRLIARHGAPTPNDEVQ